MLEDSDLPVKMECSASYLLKDDNVDSISRHCSERSSKLQD